MWHMYYHTFEPHDHTIIAAWNTWMLSKHFTACYKNVQQTTIIYEQTDDVDTASWVYKLAIDES